MDMERTAYKNLLEWKSKRPNLAKAFMNVVLTDITEEILEQASEVLVLGTTCECVAVTHYNGKPVGDGRPGPMADRLRHLLHDALVTGGVPFLE